MSDLTHVEQTVDISFGLFFYGSYCPILNTASLKFLARYIVERQMRNKIQAKERDCLLFSCCCCRDGLRRRAGGVSLDLMAGLLTRKAEFYLGNTGDTRHTCGINLIGQISSRPRRHDYSLFSGRKTCIFGVTLASASFSFAMFFLTFASRVDLLLLSSPSLQWGQAE